MYVRETIPDNFPFGILPHFFFEYRAAPWPAQAERLIDRLLNSRRHWNSFLHQIKYAPGGILRCPSGLEQPRCAIEGARSVTRALRAGNRASFVDFYTDIPCNKELRFEWDENKNEANRKKHGISFEAAVRVFDDPNLLDFVERIEGGGEALARHRLFYRIVAVPHRGPHVHGKGQ